MSVYPTPVKSLESRRKDRIHGLLIVGLTFVVCLLFSLWAKRRAEPQRSVPPAPATTVGLIGFPSSLDPVKNLPLARTLTPRNLLRDISADGVDEHGLVDVSKNGRVKYQFQSAIGQGPQPVREPGTLARRPYCGRQIVDITKTGIVAEADSADASCPSRPLDPLPEPRCTMADVWAQAVARHAPTNRGAHIEYFRALAGPAWRYEAGSVRFTLYGDCKRELEGKDAMNVGL